MQRPRYGFALLLTQERLQACACGMAHREPGEIVAA
jgi:hypothetical protein